MSQMSYCNAVPIQKRKIVSQTRFLVEYIEFIIATNYKHLHTSGHLVTYHLRRQV